MMKLLYFFSLFLIINIVLALDLCTDTDKVKIAECYNDNVFAFFPRNGFKGHFPDLIRNLTNLPVLCESKRQLDQCLGVPIIQRCLNVEDFKNVTFVESDIDARAFVAIYLQMDYGCGKTLPLLQSQHTCIFHQGNQCKMDMSNCSTANAFAACAVERVSEHCGKPAGCFVEKFTALQKCYIDETCAGCDSLNIKNKAIDAFCHDDLNSGIRYPANIVVIVVTTILSIFYH